MLEDPGVHVICKKKLLKKSAESPKSQKKTCVSFLKHPVHNIRFLVKTKQTKDTAMNHCSLTVC